MQEETEIIVLLQASEEKTGLTRNEDVLQPTNRGSIAAN